MVFQHLTIRTKLIIFMCLMGVTACALIGYVGFSAAKTALENEIFNKLKAVRDIKRAQIERYFTENASDLSVLAHSDDLRRAFEQLRQYHVRVNIGANDPNDVTRTEYLQLYEEYGQFLHYSCHQYGYEDLMIICKAHGHVMFTVAKEQDWGTNLNAGPYRDTRLAALWRRVVSSGKMAMEDFLPYAPSKNAPAAFIGLPILDKDGEMVAVLVSQISITEINTIMQERQGLGNTGETYLLGSDNRMRSDLFLDPKEHSVVASFSGTVEKNGIYTEATRLALAGKSGEKVITNYRKQTVLSAYTPVSIHDLQWILLAEMDENEAFQDVRALRSQILAWTFGIVLLIVIGAFILSRRITKPFAHVIQTVNQIAAGDLSVSIQASARDEVGDILIALQRMIDYLKEVGAVAERVAQQDLSVLVTPKSDRDVLNHSLKKMVTNLQANIDQLKTSMTELEQYAWQATGLSEIGDLMRGDQELATLARRVVSGLAVYLDAQIGAFYVRNSNDSFELVGSYAYQTPEKKHYFGQFVFGEGLNGQAALEKKTMRMSNIPSDYIKVTSGLMSAEPVSIVITPIIYETEVKGIIELGTVKEFSDADIEFLNEAASKIGVALHSVQIRTDMQRLLDKKNLGS